MTADPENWQPVHAFEPACSLLCFSSLSRMSWPAFALGGALAFVRRHALVLAFVLAFLSSLIILRRRLYTSPQSCEDETVPEPSISPSRKRRRGRTKLSLSSISGGGELCPVQHTEEARPLEDPESKADEDEGKDRMAKRYRQPYEAFLVLDVEGTCVQGSGFGYPNEIIEWPVCLLRWKDKDMKGNAQELEIVAEFRSYVRPTWRPQLSDFCQTLTGITQVQVDSAPTFPEVLQDFRTFLEKHKLLDAAGQPLQRFCFCSDGPYDVRDFVVKQCFVSKIPVPIWLSWDVMDVRRVVGAWHDSSTATGAAERRQAGASPLPKRVSFSISRQLHALGLEPFEGRQHSGIDDARNVCRLLIELARRGWRLEPNTHINPNRRWPWMGKRGKVLEEYYS
ncbi:ribonuclease H-like domain-containing protein [Ganoderma leucocontextum]|nr:ribonuclease H-like domain-containing protein [Ganoderma leucocontextum]